MSGPSSQSVVDMRAGPSVDVRKRIESVHAHESSTLDVRQYSQYSGCLGHPHTFLEAILAMPFPPKSSHYDTSHLESRVVPAGPAPKPDAASLPDHHAGVVPVIAPEKDVQRALVALVFLRRVHGVPNAKFRALAESRAWSAGFDDLKPFALAPGRFEHRDPTHYVFSSFLLQRGSQNLLMRKLFMEREMPK